MRVRSLEAMRRLFMLVLLTALFVAHLAALGRSLPSCGFALCVASSAFPPIWMGSISF